MKKGHNLQNNAKPQIGYDTLLCGVILGVLEKWSTSRYDGIWYGYNGLHDECEAKYTIKELKYGMKQLNKIGKVERKPTYTEGRVCGSGWFLNAT